MLETRTVGKEKNGTGEFEAEEHDESHHHQDEH